MRYYIVTDGTYITLIGVGLDGEEITEAAYNEIASIIANCPSAPDGYAYMLRTDLTWELIELPPEPSIEATVEDCQAALEEMGVNV